ncbi:MAG TPA: hypothetical protein VN428_11605 [Bryobacteraceae bacterium]|nr:hypothetical protein [Bryobacteraceae bacterium]
MGTTAISTHAKPGLNGKPASAAQLQPPSLFNSFWIAGFESACHLNSAGQRLDMIAVTQHDVQAVEDYALLTSVGIRTARDVVRWHLIDKGGRYDFSPLTPLADAADRAGVQVIWNLCHYGWPDGLDLFSAEFVERYARYSRAVARYFADRSDLVPFYAPVNEISFFAWAAERPILYPFATGRGDEIKKQLVRAAIAGMEAIWEVDRRARFVHGDPIIHVIPPRDRPDLAGAAAIQRAAQFSAWDTLAGIENPEVGGDPRYLDIVGTNWYHANEWECPDIRLRWEDEPRDERWLPLHLLLKEVWDRYRRPIFMAETSHFGAGRARWIREIAAEICAARGIGVPIEGVCLYPILDRPDWEDTSHWHNSGLWDLVPDGENRLVRVLNPEYAHEFAAARESLAKLQCR